MHLLPQLPAPFAELLARQLCALSIEECRARRALDHSNRVFTPTGGTRITDAAYAALREALSSIAEKAGYPRDNAGARSQFDTETAIFLHREFKITENEASKPGVWNFLSCVALPDLVRWRWLTAGDTSIDRFFAGNRNTFERLWWRAHAYYDRTKEADPYWLVREIGEDESVGIMERTGLSGMRSFVVVVLKALLEVYETKPPVARSELMRDAMKRLRRVGGIVAIEALTDGEQLEVCRSMFRESIAALAPPIHRITAEPQPAKMTSKPATPSHRPSQSKGGVSTEELAWLESEMKRNQGRRTGR